MGRRKQFDPALVLQRIQQTFIRYGYAGTSLDDLVKATGVLRGSLYSAYGSKRGMFLLALRQALADQPGAVSSRNLVCIALMELSARDPAIRELVATWAASQDPDQVAALLGRALLVKGKIGEGKIDGKPS